MYCLCTRHVPRQGQDVAGHHEERVSQTYITAVEVTQVGRPSV